MNKVAVVGFGFMGMTHALNIIKSEGLELVAIVDKDPEAVEKKLKLNVGNITTGQVDEQSLSTIRRYTKFDECLEFEELDAVHICVHTDLHYEMTKKALLHGKHVFLEKPFCLDVYQAEELIKLARQKECILMVAHVVRFMPAYQKLKKWIESGEFGALKFLSLSRFSGLPAWGEWVEKRASFGSSGGALFDLVIHDIDFVNYLLGQPGKIECDYLPGSLSNHDYLNARWHYYDKDIQVKIEGGNIFHPTFPFSASYMARFEKASLFFSTLKGDVISVSTDQGLNGIVVGSNNEGYYNEIAYFSACISLNRQPIDCSPESSLQTIQLCYNHINK